MDEKITLAHVVIAVSLVFSVLNILSFFHDDRFLYLTYVLFMIGLTILLAVDRVIEKYK